MPDVQHQGLLRVWRRHAQRRRDGAPSVSVAIVSSEHDRAAVEDTLQYVGTRLLRSSASDAQAMASEWLAGVGAECDVLDEAFGFVAGELGEKESELRAAWSARGEQERKHWLQRWGDGAEAPLKAAREVLLAAIEVGDEAQRDPVSELRELLRWLPQRERMVLCLEVSGPAALRALVKLSEAEPTWPLLALVPAEIWASVREQLDDRSRTQLQAGLLPLTADAPTPPQAESLEALSRQGNLDKLAAEAVANARRAHEQDSPEADALSERARSLAEARLFALLQADPTTHDLFALNVRLPFTFGPSRIEVDLVCAELRIALEVDGYYHFRETEAYRRDRRKDVVLQHQGYLVSRHLASDVVERAGEVVRAIRALVLRRRRSLSRENAS